MKYKLKKGQALVITGTQCSGKTTLARKIAESYGSFAHIGAARLMENFGLSEAMESEPKTLIVDGFPTEQEAVNSLKALITSDTVCVNRRFSEPSVVNTPNFIFCSGHADPLKLAEGERRFRVVHLGTPA